MDIIGGLEREMGHLLHRDQPAPTFTPAARIRPARQSQPEVPAVSVLSTIHKDLSNAGSALQHAWPIISAVVNNPLLDAIAEAELGLVLSPGEVQAVVAFVKAIEAERGAPAPPSPAQQQADGNGAQQAAQAQARTAPAVV